MLSEYYHFIIYLSGTKNDKEFDPVKNAVKILT